MTLGVSVGGLCPKQWTLDFLGDPTRNVGGLMESGSPECRAKMFQPDHRGSKIIFAPGTNFDAKKSSSKPSTFFNIRPVESGNRTSKRLSGPPDSTKVSDGAFVTRRARHNPTDAYNLLNLSNDNWKLPSKTSSLWNIPVPMSLSTSTLCSYVGEEKRLLSKSKGNLIKDTVGELETGSVPSRKPTLLPNTTFPPAMSRRSLVVENQLDKHLERKLICASRYSRNYSSTDSLNLYRTQSLMSLDKSSTDVFRPYRHVPNLVDSVRHSTGFLRDHERIRMLGEQFMDVNDKHRQRAYGVEYNVIPDKDFIVDI